MPNIEVSHNAGKCRAPWPDYFVAAGLSLGAVVALGLSRFAYALILPAMRQDLGLTYLQAGSLNTANGIGYVLGALTGALAARYVGQVRCFVGAFAVSVLVLLGTSFCESLTAVFVLRTLGGVSTAWTFIVGAGLAAAIAPADAPARRGMLLGLYVMGAGLGIFLAGLTIPGILEAGADHWPTAWLTLGLIAAASWPLAWCAARRVAPQQRRASARLAWRESIQLMPTMLGYVCFGAGNVGYMTFVIALLSARGGSAEQLALFWICLGGTAVLTLVWGRLLGILPTSIGPAIVYGSCLVGTLPILLSSSPAAMYASAVVFGGSHLAGPTAIAIVAQRQLKAESWTAAIGLLTVAFALGQAIGPVLAGWMSDRTGSLSAGFWLAPALLGLAAFFSLFQRPPTGETDR